MLAGIRSVLRRNIIYIYTTLYIPLYIYTHTALHNSHALQSLRQLPKPEPYQAPSSSSVKLHIRKQERDSQKNFQKDKKPIRCVKSLTFRNHLGKAAHADLSTKVWML